MQFNNQFYQDNIHGSAGFGGKSEAKILSKGAGPIGTFDNITLRRRTDEPTLVLGGAGSGKGANLGLYTPVHPSTGSFFILDLSGQYMSTTWHYNLAQQRECYAINVEGASAYPEMNHPVNLWGILKDDDFLFDNARRIASMALRSTANSLNSENAWVFTGAQRWLCRIILAEVFMSGRATPKRVWEIINMIDGDIDGFVAWAKPSEGLSYDIHSTLLEIYNKKHDSEREFGAIMGKIKDDLDWLSSPKVAESVSGDEDYLADLCHPAKKVGIYYALRGGSAKTFESLTRMVVGIAMLHCMRANTSQRPLFYLEEAASMGSAEFIKSAVSECRKYFDTTLVYQSHGQIAQHFGDRGAQEIVDSCGMQIILGGGVRDIQSAERFSKMLGQATIEVDDRLAQQDRVHKAETKRQQAMWGGMDPIEAERQYRHEMHQSHHKKKVRRNVMDPTEVMRLKDQVLIFTPSLGLPPLLAQKLPKYFENPAMIGKYGPDPLFSKDTVSVRHRIWGKGKRKFMRERVPEHLKMWPNHRTGEIAYVEGHRTW